MHNSMSIGQAVILFSLCACGIKSHTLADSGDGASGALNIFALRTILDEKPTIDSYARTLTVHSLASGRAYSFPISEAGVLAKDLQCSPLPSHVKIELGVLHVLERAQSEDLTLHLTCATGGGPLNVFLEFKASKYEVVSGTLELGSEYYGWGVTYSASDDGSVMVVSKSTLSSSNTELANLYAQNQQSGKSILLSSRDGVEPGNGKSTFAGISQNGSRVMFQSTATNLLVANSTTVPGAPAYYVKDLNNPSLPARVFPLGTAVEGPIALSADGRFLLYRTKVAASAGGFTYVIERLDLSDPNSTPVAEATWTAISSPEPGAMSSNGRYLAYIVGSGSGGNSQLLIKDMAIPNAAGSAISSTTLTSGTYLNPSISADGRFVAYMLNLPNGGSEILVRDLSLQSPLPRYVIGNPAYTKDGISYARNPRLSDDGHYLAYESAGPTPTAVNPSGLIQVWLLDLTSSASSPVLVSALSSSGSDFASSPRFSMDHSSIDFTSFASNLTGQDGHGLIFRKSLSNPTGSATILVPAGVAYMGAGASRNPSVSGDGTMVAFDSIGDNLLSGKFGGQQILVKDLSHPENPPILASSLNADPRNRGSLPCVSPQMSFDGKSVSFYTQSPELAPGTTLAAGAWAHVKKDLTNLAAAPTVLGTVTTTPAVVSTLSSPDNSFKILSSFTVGAFGEDDMARITLGVDTSQLLLKHNP